MRGMHRLFQGAATVDSILRGNLIERAAEAGLRSIFVGFETLTPANLASSNKRQNLGRDYAAVTKRLHDLGIMINGSFVFGMDDDDTDVFRRTVDWAVEHGITTATFHIQTPYPGTRLFARMEAEGRILTRDWDKYDTRHVVYQPGAAAPDGAEGRLRLGVPRVLQVVVDRARLAGARKHQAPVEALLLRRGLEEIREALGPCHPREATAVDDARAGGGAFEDHAQGRSQKAEVTSKSELGGQNFGLNASCPPASGTTARHRRLIAR